MPGRPTQPLLAPHTVHLTRGSFVTRFLDFFSDNVKYFHFDRRNSICKRQEGVNASVLQRREGCRDGLQNSCLCDGLYFINQLSLKANNTHYHYPYNPGSLLIYLFICADRIILFPGGIQHLNVNDSLFSLILN